MVDPDVVRKRKRDYMAASRKDPVKRQRILESQRKAWAKSGSQNRKDWMCRLRTEDPWRWKALTIHTSSRGKLYADDLRRLWDRQAGLCGLTGTPLDFKDAELDHIIPRSRGGGSGIDNVRWVCSAANQAKHGMTDAEFVTLCSQVAEWIGRRIMDAVPSLPPSPAAKETK